MKILYYALLLCTLVLNCTIVSLKGSGLNQPISVSNMTGNEEYTVVRSNVVWERTVEASKVADFDIRMAILDMFAETPGDAIINLKFKVHQTFGQYCLEGLTLGLYKAYKVVVTGDVIKYK